MGYSEAEWWDRFLFSDKKTARETAKKYGLDEDLCENCTEYFDFFEKGANGATFVNSLGIYRAKLDWLLIHRKFLKFVGGGTSGQGLSDHLCLWNDVQFV